VILIVDDETWFVSPLRRAFEMEGFKTAIAANPDECLEMISGNETVDAIILDVMLPSDSLDLEETDSGLSAGLVPLQRIRKKRPHVPIVISSVRRDLSVQESDHPATVVISKSAMTPNPMVEMIQRLVQTQTKRKG